jgi:hypothetical protein
VSLLDLQPGAGAADPPGVSAYASGRVGQASAPVVEDVEIDLLVEGIRRVHGVDLRHVYRPGLEESIRRLVSERRLRSISALLEQVLPRAAWSPRCAMQTRSLTRSFCTRSGPT